MIKVIYNDNTVRVSGHANYAEYGKDIVCASVSSVIATIVNCIMNIDKSSITYQDDGKTIIITKINNKSIEYSDDSNVITIKKINSNEIVNIIINTMIEILKDLERQYKENIKIESEE